MLEIHGNISILLSDVQDLLICDSPRNFIDLILNVPPHAKQTELNEIGAQYL